MEAGPLLSKGDEERRKNRPEELIHGLDPIGLVGLRRWLRLLPAHASAWWWRLLLAHAPTEHGKQPAAVWARVSRGGQQWAAGKDVEKKMEKEGGRS